MRRTVSMTLWSVQLLLLLFRAPSSESRLLAQEQFRASTKALCDEEAVSNSLGSSTSELVVSRSSFAVSKSERSGHISESEILNNLGKGSPPSSPSPGSHRVADKKIHGSPQVVFEKLASEHNRQEHISESEILNNLGKGSPPSSPSPGNHRVTEIRNNLGKGSSPSSPSSGNHRVAEKKIHRSPPAVFEKLALENNGQTHSSESESLGSPPSSSSPGNHLVPEKKTHRSPPTAMETMASEHGGHLSESEILNNLGKGSLEIQIATETEISPNGSPIDIVGCSDSIWDSVDNLAHQFVNSVRRITLYT